MPGPEVIAAFDAVGREADLVAIAAAQDMAVVLVTAIDDRSQFLVFVKPGATRVEHVASSGIGPVGRRHLVTDEPELIQGLWSAAFGAGTPTCRPITGWVAVTGVAAADAKSVRVQSSLHQEYVPARTDGRFLALLQERWGSSLRLSVVTRDGRTVPVHP